jgi:hypothetical protein
MACLQMEHVHWIILSISALVDAFTDFHFSDEDEFIFISTCKPMTYIASQTEVTSYSCHGLAL